MVGLVVMNAAFLFIAMHAKVVVAAMNWLPYLLRTGAGIERVAISAANIDVSPRAYFFAFFPGLDKPAFESAIAMACFRA